MPASFANVGLETACCHIATNLTIQICLFHWFLNVLVNNWAISRTGPKTEGLTILRAATHEAELGDHDFCLSRSNNIEVIGFERIIARALVRSLGSMTTSV